MFRLNIVNDILNSAFITTTKLNHSFLWHARLGHLHFKRMQDMYKDELIPAFDMDTENDFCDLHAIPSLGNKKYFVTFIDDASRFSSIPKPSQKSLINRTRDIGRSMFPEEVVDEDDPKTFDELMKSQDVAFWKEAINDEMDSIIGNNTWVLADLPPGCKWIFKKKIKVNGTVKKFKAKLVIQGFRQMSGIDYFDTYTLVACISTIRLLIALASIHNLIVHQMDVKTAFLNGELDEEADKCVYSKFNESGKEVVICLYVDDMLIFGTHQV
ncbi:zinc finger, CCHC-type containing protein [Tanacetum coccineum]